MIVPANIASRIISNILLPDTESFFSRDNPRAHVAFSPVMPHVPDGEPTPIFQAEIKLPRLSLQMRVVNRDLPSELIAPYAAHLHETAHRAGVFLSILLKRRVSVTPALPSAHAEAHVGARIDISVIISGNDAGFSLIVPTPLLRLFAPALDKNAGPEDLESAVIAYLQDPWRLVPALESLIASLPDIELQALLYHLLNRSLLTDYQILLMVEALPAEALRIKRNLSTHTVDAVLELMRRYGRAGGITTRDVRAGVYSIEEAIYFLIREGDAFGYAPFLRMVQSANRLAATLDVLSRKSFRQWVLEIAEDGLLFSTIAACDELTCARAISDDPGPYLGLFGKHVSPRAVDAIADLVAAHPVTAMERMSSQGSFIAEYRRQRIRRRRLGDESFLYLLRRFARPADFRHLLTSVGWFTLSTSLKGARANYLGRLIAELPEPARFLVEDVIRGTVNPNIVHGEMQIRQARARCVQAITTLYEDGLILLTD